MKVEKGFNIWVYSGFTFDELLILSKKNPVYLEFLSYIDVLVDGPYIDEQRNLMLKFRGSENQRLIDVRATRSNNKVTLLNI